MKTVSSVVKLPKDLIERLKALRRPHQSIAGVIEELLPNKPSPATAVSPIIPTQIAPEEVDVPIEAERYADDHVAPLPEGTISMRHAIELVQVVAKKHIIKESDILRWAKKGIIKVTKDQHGDYQVDRDSIDYFIDNYSIK